MQLTLLTVFKSDTNYATPAHTESLSTAFESIFIFLAFLSVKYVYHSWSEFVQFFSSVIQTEQSCILSTWRL